MGHHPRKVPLPELSALLYALMALLMVGAVGLCLHGIGQSWAAAERSLALRQVVTILAPEAVAVAKGADPAEFEAAMIDWLSQTSPDPERAAAVLAAARAEGADGNPRLVARQDGDAFDDSAVSGSVLQATLFLIMRDDRARATETVINALAERYGKRFGRVDLREAIEAWQAGDTAVAPDIADRIAGIADRETGFTIIMLAVLRSFALLCLLVAAGFYGTRFAGDAHRLYRLKQL